MYSVLKYLTQNAVAGRASNSELAGGLPHSEIRGSKPILGSPRLIAEYHVLHRLLLPRHSPNALLALDLIQRGQDESCTARRLAAPRLRFRIKSILSRRARLAPRPETTGSKARRGLVYLTWTARPVSGRTRRTPRTCGAQDRLRCISLHDVSGPCGPRPDWTGGRRGAPSSDPVPDAGWFPKQGVVEPTGIEPVTS